ncbi:MULTISPECIES: WXG100 family type VII secretion target [unclassified Rhodococcus (in: high G+C Gram-positive bacteria)]|uniref:WXG100 family type VII secretion target n=1 Tax=unclassified Rhodococcus (in: high G+C Gram-positive bacteria) TaxID=192944 RepID=UPI0025EACC4E|nr:WXG100 family type VII secretion target [Rhodococcus sp. (in: high G+C Gram-positive bacteria)]
MTEPSAGAGSGHSNGLSTDVATMEVVAGQLQDSRNELVGILRVLGDVVQSAPSVWRGVSATRFAGIMERWNVNNTNLTAALDELAEAVRTSGRSYDATEQENARALGAVDPGAGSLLRGSF